MRQVISPSPGIKSCTNPIQVQSYPSPSIHLPFVSLELEVNQNDTLDESATQWDLVDLAINERSTARARCVILLETIQDATQEYYQLIKKHNLL